MSPREHGAATVPVLVGEQAQEREDSIALILRHQFLRDIEGLDAMPALDAQWHQRIERDPEKVTDITSVPDELAQPAALFVREEDRRVRIGHHREDIVRDGVEDAR
jgi:hypothetical protein